MICKIKDAFSVRLQRFVTLGFCGLKYIPEMQLFATECGEYIGELFYTTRHIYCPFCGRKRKYLYRIKKRDIV